MTYDRDNKITVATEKLLLLFLLSALSSKKPQAVFIYYQEFSISRIIKKNLRYLRHQRDKNITHADFADYADCHLIICVHQCHYD